MTRENSLRRVYIKKRNLPEWLTCYIFAFPFLLSFFLEFLRLPGVFKYTVDAAWIIVLSMLIFRKKLILEKRIAPFAIFITLLFLYMFVVYLFNFQSPFYFIWGVRNNFRMYIAFLAYAIFFEEDDAFSCLKFVDILFWINIPVTFIQYFFMGYEQDRLGGIFGVEVGCNAYSLLLLTLVLGRSLLLYMNGQEKSTWCFLKCAFALVISAMAELKVFFVIFAVLLALAALLTKFSWKKVVIILLAGILVTFAGAIFTAIWGEDQALTFDSIMEVVFATNYSSKEDLGRLTAIATLSKNILTDWPERLFGMGLGNCETSSISIFNTPFYQTHFELHYFWLSSAMLWLETGYIGLACNLAFYVICFVCAFRYSKKNMADPILCQICMLVSVICIILTFYNAALQKEVGYIAYFALALPLISAKNHGRQSN